MSAMSSPTGFLITFCVGVAAALAWQSYGDAAREAIANSSQQLGWLAPQPAPTAQNSPDGMALVAPAAPSPDQQQLNAMLHEARQSVDQIAASQEQITHSVDRIAPSVATNQEQMTHTIDRIATSQEQLARKVDQLTTGQEQMTREITKLQEIAQYILYKNSEPPPRPAPAQVPKPALRPSQAPTALTPARNP